MLALRKCSAVPKGTSTPKHTKLTEPAIVVRTLDLALLRVCIQALVARRAVTVLGVPPALGHPPEVVLVQELTCITLFTQATKPVLAHGGQTLTVPRVHGKLFGRLEVQRRWIGMA
jgi:hypothetical protein